MEKFKSFTTFVSSSRGSLTCFRNFADTSLQCSDSSPEDCFLCRMKNPLPDGSPLCLLNYNLDFVKLQIQCSQNTSPTVTAVSKSTLPVMPKSHIMDQYPAPLMGLSATTDPCMAPLLSITGSTSMTERPPINSLSSSLDSQSHQLLLFDLPAPQFQTPTPRFKHKTKSFQRK